MSARGMIGALYARESALEAPEWFSLMLTDERQAAFDAHPLRLEDPGTTALVLQVLFDIAVGEARRARVADDSAAVALVAALATSRCKRILVS